MVDHPGRRSGGDSRSATRLPAAVACVAAAVLPPEVGGPDPDLVATRVLGYLGHLPPPARSAASSGFVGVSVLLRLQALGRDPRTLAPEARTRLLARLAALGPDAAQAVEGLKAVILLAHGSGAFAAEIRARAQRNPPVGPDADLDVTPATDWPARSSADVVVVGSGAGGAMVARTLARTGAAVVVVEEGRRWGVEEFRTMDPLDRYAGLYRDGGATVALGRPPVVLPIGRAVGGTTVVNSGTCYRPPVDVQLRWRDQHHLPLADPDALGPYLDEVEATLAVAPVPLDVMGSNGRTLLRGAEALGWRAGPLVRNAPGCDGCCQCALGCPHNAKAGVHRNALPQACAAGARIVSEARVRRILVESGRAVGVEVQRADGTTLEVRAPRVVVAAGATETPGLLGRSGVGHHPELGRNLAIHPALAAAGRFDEPVVSWEGVLQSAAVEQWHASHRILIEATATPPGMGSLVLPGLGRPLVEAVAGADHLALLGAMIGDEPSGRVQWRSGQSLLTYSLHPRDARRLVVALSAMGRVLLAAGAREVICGLPGQGPARTTDELDDQLTAVDPRALHLAAFHPTGTARAGGDAQASPVDAEGRLRGVESLWVADASIVPSCPEVNPQVTIMALALAVADGVAVAT